MDTKTWCRNVVLAVWSHEGRVSELQACTFVNQSSNPPWCCCEYLHQTPRGSVKAKFGKAHTFSLGYWASQQISYQPRSRATTEVRGQMKKVSWRWTRLPLEVFSANGIKRLMWAVSFRHTEPLPSSVSSHNWRANFETDVQPCLDALMWFSFIWIMKELSTILVSLFLSFPVSSVLLSSSIPAK